MSKISPIEKFPEDIKKELDQRLLNPGLSLKDCLQWLAEQGCQSHKSNLYRRRVKLAEAKAEFDWLKSRINPALMTVEALFKEQAMLTPFGKRLEMIQVEIGKRYAVEVKS